ncbi:GntR family transcriptional regulator [Weissella paramesenteroides]|jgi:GntR family transcriptional regulator|uniref:Transcriptional regulator, GntR family n=1 Tax=Weissella paramesenteroides ATCC 33313 TaxID=585506 RepID=C5R9S7_WEIPA|nr:GntR family transcriptional regulator [Weissella paramesenteroides]ATF42062.1 GntR family transcriptional regulator [Weissella paramesenteroides]EER75177.1 transcriptional regulator, GntR family [Weissella paramesenteroides ATCC 33313]KAA8439902.1 GntR family transcriptional regulator [Weissella paramesenteroides]KAA8441341.1 GntR family transcriptional regulator [Weissella paramesenteroides]KAA8444083.1 GntR family transcriptional regulator [Weissella paramesenteroides]
MEFSSNQPIYLQVATWLEQQILEGKYQIGHKIPGVRDLAVNLIVSTRTVQNAVNQLVTRGLIVTKRGQGNFVTEDAAKIDIIRLNKKMRVTQEYINEIMHVAQVQEIPGLIASAIKEYEDEQTRRGNVTG